MKLRLRPLEDRLAPANLTLTGITLRDGDGNLLAAPMYGQKIFARAAFTSTAMSGGEGVVVRFSANAMPLDTPPQTITAGNGSWTANEDGWFVGTTAITLTATVDPNGTIAETNEADNTLSITITPIAPTTLSSKFTLPLGRTMNDDWAIGNYADVDPRDGFAQDALGGRYQYDGHDAIDAGPFDFAAMDAGFPVYAAADGVVLYMAEGNFDRQIYGATDGGNWVYLDHGNGWHTFYGHMAKNSLTVKLGDTVKQGQVLGLMGSSGYSGGPHVHWNIDYRGAIIEPLFAPTSYWQGTPPPYAGNVNPFVFDAFVTNREPDYYENLEKTPRVNKFSTTDTSTLYFVVENFNIRNMQTSTVMAWKWYKPDGSLWNTWGTTYEAADVARNAYWYWYWNVSDFAFAPGQWRCDFLQGGVNGTVVASVPFTIGASSDPSLKVTTPGQVPEADLVIDERTTPIRIGTAASGGTAPTKVFTIENQGGGSLTVGPYTLPQGFSIVGAAPAFVAPNSSATLTVRLDTTVVGDKYGTLSFPTNDPEVPMMNFVIEGSVTGSFPAGNPVLTQPDPALAFNFKSLPRRVAPNAVITDSNSTTLSALSVYVAAGSDGYDNLQVRNEGNSPGQVGVSGQSIFYGGVLIGTRAVVPAPTSITINFNANATLAAVQAVMRNVTYAHSGPIPFYNRRDLMMAVLDPTGLASNWVVRTVTPSGVERAPVIAPIAAATVIPTAAFNRTGSFSDSFGSSWSGTVNYGAGGGNEILTIGIDKTFSLSRAYTSTGNYTVTVTINSDTGGTSTSTFPVSVVSAPVFSALSINGGAAQRSRVTSLAVTFSNSVSAAVFQEPNAVTLVNGSTVVKATASPGNGSVTNITLTIPDQVGVEFGSLADGNWQLKLPGYQSATNAIRRLFGDVNGDGTVDGGSDFSQFRFETSVDNPFDFNADGTVDGGTDFAQFGIRFGRTI